jgi:hypothetical protein
VILGILAGLVLICVCAGVGAFLMFRSTGQILANSFETDPAKVGEVSAEIADYTLPAGFSQSYATSLVDFSMVAHTGEDGNSHIYFFQMPAGVKLDQAEIERQMRQTIQNEKGYQRVKMQVVDRQAATIRGQDVELVVSEGINHTGDAYREVSGLFQGKGGQALVVVSHPVESWDWETVNDFIASIQ